MTVLCDYSVVHAGRVVIENGSDPNDPNIEFEKDGSAFGKGSPMFSKKFQYGRTPRCPSTTHDQRARTDGRQCGGLRQQ
jgi:hypothetical protein